MLKKEWRDIFLPALLRLSLAPLFAVMHAVINGRLNAETRYTFFIGYVISVYWVAIHIGLNAFRSEFRDRSFEYLLTFPISRLRLIVSKLAPRFLFLAILLVIYRIFFELCLFDLFKDIPQEAIKFVAEVMNNSPVFSLFHFILWVLFIFFSGFFLSLVDWKAFRSAMPFTILSVIILVSGLFQELVRGPGHTKYISLLSVIPFLAVVGMFFIFSVWKIDRWTRGNGWGKGNKKSSAVLVCQKNGQNWGILRLEWPLVARNLLLSFLFIPVMGLLMKFVRLDVNEHQIRPDSITAYAFIAGFLLLFFAFSSGNSLFYREFRHRAAEYILTFPLGLPRILFEKLLARVLVLAPVAIAYTIFASHFSERISHNSGMLYVLLRPAFFPFWMALLLLNGFFLSLFEMKNIMALVSLANLYALVLIPLALFRLLKHFAIALSPQTITMLAIGSGLVLTTMILAGVFFRFLPRFDLAAPRRYSKVFGWFLFTTFTILSLAGFAVVLFV